MSKKRLIQIFIVASVVTLFVLVTQEVLTSANVISQGNSIEGTKTSECASLPSRYSIRTEVIKETGTRLAYTEDGPAGLDGGLIDLYSKYRTCSAR